LNRLVARRALNWLLGTASHTLFEVKAPRTFRLAAADALHTSLAFELNILQTLNWFTDWLLWFLKLENFGVDILLELRLETVNMEWWVAALANKHWSNYRPAVWASDAAGTSPQPLTSPLPSWSHTGLVPAFGALWAGDHLLAIFLWTFGAWILGNRVLREHFNIL